MKLAEKAKNLFYKCSKDWSGKVTKCKIQWVNIVTITVLSILSSTLLFSSGSKYRFDENLSCFENAKNYRETNSTSEIYPIHKVYFQMDGKCPINSESNPYKIRMWCVKDKFYQGMEYSKNSNLTCDFSIFKDGASINLQAEINELSPIERADVIIHYDSSSQEINAHIFDGKNLPSLHDSSTRFPNNSSINLEHSYFTYKFDENISCYENMIEYRKDQANIQQQHKVYFQVDGKCIKSDNNPYKIRMGCIKPIFEQGVEYNKSIDLDCGFKLYKNGTMFRRFPTAIDKLDNNRMADILFDYNSSTNIITKEVFYYE
jgi:hypothetical protein